ncbi:hypothetical protein JCM15060_17670 [Halanaerobaculum tunisiense]
MTNIKVEDDNSSLIGQHAKNRDLPYLTMCYSPGYGDLALNIQLQLLKFLNGIVST